MEKDISNLNKKVTSSHKELETSYLAKIKELEKKLEANNKNTDINVNNDLLKRINGLESLVKKRDVALSSNTVQHKGKKIRSTNTEFRAVVKYDNQEDLATISFNLADDKQNTPENTIAAGSFVKAVLLSGVEAATGVQSKGSKGGAGNPRPIILKLIDDASLPNEFKSKVKSCRLIGAATGDISSERVEIRLEIMSCIDVKTKKITEGPVKGYVAGEDGRAGMRGSIVIRDRELMMSSLLGGVLGGASQAVSQLAAPVSSFNPMTGNVSTSQGGLGMLKQSGGAGMAGALDRYAKYHIERAEMLQPVIQVSSGRIVDVVFTRGFSFAGINNPAPTPTSGQYPQQKDNRYSRPVVAASSMHGGNPEIKSGEKFGQDLLNEYGGY